MTETPAAETVAAPPPGGDEAYAALFHGHFWGLVRLAHLLGADDPEDVVQNAFVRLHGKRGTLRDQNAALAYLRSTVCNASRSRLRHLRMARRRHAQLAVLGDAASAEHQAVHREDIRALLDVVEQLPRRQREVLVLRYWLDLSERETADALGIAVGTVKGHCGRAIAAIRDRLKEGT
ncbi:SigE family RNA polymerase sigma factor [Actinomadura fulvescens]|uniref:SigE family RNA polymerase sigma factor n=1 Tax=Actinomadura fulvescens TaxID=46160 RepID=UPI0031CEE311